MVRFLERPSIHVSCLILAPSQPSSPSPYPYPYPHPSKAVATLTAHSTPLSVSLRPCSGGMNTPHPHPLLLSPMIPVMYGQCSLNGYLMKVRMRLGCTRIAYKSYANHLRKGRESRTRPGFRKISWVSCCTLGKRLHKMGKPLPITIRLAYPIEHAAPSPRARLLMTRPHMAS